MPNNTKLRLTGIVKTIGGEYMFKVCHQDKEQLNKIKDAMRWIFRDSDFNIDYETAMFDDFNQKGDRR